MSHLSPGGCQNLEVDFETPEAFKKVQRLCLICPLSCHLLQLPPYGQDLVLARHSADLEIKKKILEDEKVSLGYKNEINKN